MHLNTRLVAEEMVSPMMYRMYATAYIVFFGVALTLAPNESFGRSGAALSGQSASTRSASHPSALRTGVHANFSSHRDHRQRNAGWALWSTAGSFYGINQGVLPSDVERSADITRSMSDHVTYTYDVPWDAVHRYPRVYEYASGCRSQNVMVPRGDGKRQSVSIVRCY